MVFIINNKKYNTDKMDKVGEVMKFYELRGWLSKQVFGEHAGRMYKCELWKSAKGNWLLTHDDGGIMGEAINEQEARELLKKSDYQKYEELFGELDEA